MIKIRNKDEIKHFIKKYIIDVVVSSVIWTRPQKATRSTWWLSKLYVFLFFVITFSIIRFIPTELFFFFSIPLYIFLFYIQINISIKRFRDIGMPIYLILFTPVPLIGHVLFLILGFCHSESETEHKLTFKKLFLASFTKKHDRKLDKKESSLAFLLAFFTSVGLYVSVLMGLSMTVGVVSGILNLDLISNTLSYSILAVSVLLSGALFVYSSKIIIKKMERQ